MSAPELGKKVNVSIALIVAVATISFSLGGVVTGLLGLDGKIVDEVGGLRSDWERENENIYQAIDGVNGRIDRKINNHEDIHHKK